MCKMCKTNNLRTYTHARIPYHRKMLYKIMKFRLAIGYYK